MEKNLKILVVGYTHSRNDKRVSQSIRILGNIGSIFYQYTILGSEKNNPIATIDNPIVSLRNYPIKYPEKSHNVIHWYLKWRRFKEKIKNILYEVSPDLLYLHNFLDLDILKISKRMGSKIIMDFHELIPYTFMSKYKISRLIRIIKWLELKAAMKLIDACVFVSSEMASIIFLKTGIIKPHIIIPNYAKLSLDPLPIEAREKSIAIVGKSPRGESKLDELLNQFKEEGFDILLIGRSKGDLSFSKSIGFLPYPKMIDRISKVMFTFISSMNNINIIFSLPNRFFDSLAAGTPVIADFRNVSMSNIIYKDKTGVLIDQYNPVAAIKSIREYIKNYNNNLIFLKEKIRNYIWDENKEKVFLNFIESVLER